MSSSTTIADFPEEILAHIFKEGTIRDLKRYSLVCSDWQLPAQRELFHLATFTITRLDVLSPLPIPYSTLTKDNRYSYLGPTIRALHIGLRGRTPIDPEFPTFIESLTGIETIYFTNQTGQFLFEEITSFETRSALLGLFRRPSLRKLVINTDYFPITLVQICTHLKSLSWTWSNSTSYNSNPQWNIAGDGDDVHPPDITDVTLSGDGQAVYTFTQWLKDPSRIPTNKIKHTTLDFSSIPQSWKKLFSAFSSITHLTLRSNFCKLKICFP